MSTKQDCLNEAKTLVLNKQHNEDIQKKERQIFGIVFGPKL